MMLNLNQVYKFIFTQQFIVLNGTYQVVEITSYENAVNLDKVDFTQYLYKPANLDGSTLTADSVNYVNQAVFKLVSIDKFLSDGKTALVLYVPQACLASLPDPTVQKYTFYSLRVPIGPFADTTKFSWIKSQIDDIVGSITGVANSSQWFFNSKFDRYLTNAEYAQLDAQRTANITTVSPVQVQLQAALAQIDLLKAQNAALQQIIISASL